jgi:S1-C subfamily serine protease
MKRFVHLLSVLILALLLSACANYQEVYDKGLDFISQSNYSSLSDALNDLNRGDADLYNNLVIEFDNYVIDKFNRYLDQNQPAQARTFLTRVINDVSHFERTRYDMLQVRLLSAEGKHFESLLLYETLDIPNEFLRDYQAVQSDVLSYLVAELYRYYWDARTISDFVIIEEQLRYAFSLLSEREQYLLAYDLIDLQWHHFNFDLNDIFIDRFVRDVLPQYYDEFMESNEEIESLSYVPSASEMAAYLEPKSAIVQVFNSSGRRLGAGSAFFVNDNGLLVTNYHVVEGASRVSIITSDGKTHDVNVLLIDEIRDVAILKAPIRNNDYVLLGNSYYVQTGDTVFTYGSPLGITNTITAGLVSKNLSIVNGQEFIQLSAPISPGSSGGMLVNEYGEVIGITTASFIHGQNMNLAIPINRAINLINEIDRNIAIYPRGNGHIPDITSQTIRRIYKYSFQDLADQEVFGFLDRDYEYIYSIIHYTNGNRFEGEMRNGNFHGLITYLGNDYFYYGQASNGDFDGFGVTEYFNGSFHIGLYKDGLRNGQGSFYWGSTEEELFGHAYIGTFNDGWLTGRGTYLWPNGDIYEGDFVENNRIGRGIYYFFNGAVYEGAFLDNESHGLGVFTFVNGDVYEGDFIRGERTGQGTLFIQSTGDVYTGGFLNSSFHGFGIYRWRSGGSHEGSFVNDRPLGTGTRNYSNGDRFIASWTNWSDGIGTYYFNNGTSEPARLLNGVWD